MTLQKKLKKAIRARSEKTGESYTSARRQILLAYEKKAAAAQPLATVAVVDSLPEPTPRAATKGGVREEAVREKTGHGLDHWFAVLDAFGMAAKGHTASAAYLHQEHGVPGWYAQGITLAYERAHGLREKNQACTGDFQVSVTKTVPAAMAEVVEALQSADRRAAWLQGADPTLVEAIEAAFTGPKPRQVKVKGTAYAWLRFPWDGSTVEIRVSPKPKGSSVVADSTKLTGAGQVEERRAQWRTALAGLHRHLS